MAVEEMRQAPMALVKLVPPCGEIVELLLRLREITSTSGIGRVGVYPGPDREQQLGRQAVARALGNRVEQSSIARRSNSGPRIQRVTGGSLPHPPFSSQINQYR